MKTSSRSKTRAGRLEEAEFRGWMTADEKRNVSYDVSHYDDYSVYYYDVSSPRRLRRRRRLVRRGAYRWYPGGRGRVVG